MSQQLTNKSHNTWEEDAEIIDVANQLMQQMMGTRNQHINRKQDDRRIECQNDSLHGINPKTTHDTSSASGATSRLTAQNNPPISSASQDNDSSSTRLDPTKQIYSSGSNVQSTIINPLPNDVLYGRGAGVNYHPGNIKYRNLVQSQKLAYINADPRTKKSIIHTIANTIVQPPQSGRFLKCNSTSGLWECISMDLAKVKIGQALREDAPKLKKMSIINEYLQNELHTKSPLMAYNTSTTTIMPKKRPLQNSEAFLYRNDLERFVEHIDIEGGTANSNVHSHTEYLQNELHTRSPLMAYNTNTSTSSITPTKSPLYQNNLERLVEHIGNGGGSTNGNFYSHAQSPHAYPVQSRKKYQYQYQYQNQDQHHLMVDSSTSTLQRNIGVPHPMLYYPGSSSSNSYRRYYNPSSHIHQRPQFRSSNRTSAFSRPLSASLSPSLCGGTSTPSMASKTREAESNKWHQVDTKNDHRPHYQKPYKRKKVEK